MIQERYYTDTAAQYDALHGGDEPLARYALRYLSAIINQIQPASILDVGAGTGRTLAYLQEHYPHIGICGVEPVAALRDVAISKGISPECLFEGDGYELPFPDASIDIVVECAVLHHVQEPARVVSEMCRVARRAVFIADANRFGQGSMAGRWLKLAAYRAGLWPVFEAIRTRGKNYHISENDGLFYSYSIYDNLAQLSAWADDLIIVPAATANQHSWLHPLLTSAQAVAIAIREAASEPSRCHTEAS